MTNGTLFRNNVPFKSKFIKKYFVEIKKISKFSDMSHPIVNSIEI